MPTIKLTKLGPDRNSRVRWKVDTDHGVFKGEAGDEQEAVGQAREVAYAHGHDETDVEVAERTGRVAR